MSVLVLIIAYVVGGVPFAVLVVRLVRGSDVRRSGSGNVGARNSLRVGGPVAGALVLILDALKGAAMVWLARSVVGGAWAGPLAGTLAVLGHCFSPFLIAQAVRAPWRGWRVASLRVGGMGLATALGVLLLLAPVVVPLALGIGIIVAMATRKTVWAAVAIIIATPLAVIALGYERPIVIATLLSAIIIFSKHLQDIFPDPQVEQLIQAD